MYMGYEQETIIQIPFYELYSVAYIPLAIQTYQSGLQYICNIQWFLN